MSDVASYEQEVLATVEDRLRKVTQGPSWSDPRRQVREVRLEGAHPHTRLVVVFDDPEFGSGLEEHFSIHRLKGPHGEPMDPEAIATIVWANVDEFGRGPGDWG